MFRSLQKNDNRWRHFPDSVLCSKPLSRERTTNVSREYEFEKQFIRMQRKNIDR